MHCRALSFAVGLIPMERMVCAHTNQRGPLRGSRRLWVIGSGSIWVPSCSPWPHPDKKQTNQQNKCATEPAHVPELGRQQQWAFLWSLCGSPQVTHGETPHGPVGASQPENLPALPHYLLSRFFAALVLFFFSADDLQVLGLRWMPRFSRNWWITGAENLASLFPVLVCSPS